MTAAVSLKEQIAAAARELALRRNVYPKWIEKGRMKQEQADKEIAAMDAVIKTLVLVDLLAATSRAIMDAIPTRRDWLDPELERQANALFKAAAEGGPAPAPKRLFVAVWEDRHQDDTHVVFRDLPAAVEWARRLARREAARRQDGREVAERQWDIGGLLFRATYSGDEDCVSVYQTAPGEI